MHFIEQISLWLNTPLGAAILVTACLVYAALGIWGLFVRHHY